MTSFRRLTAGLLLAAALTSTHMGFALEPQNNTAPWAWPQSRGDATIYNADGLSSGWGDSFEDINSSSDVDYFLVMCTGRKITSVGIGFTQAGDLDIQVFDPAGSLLGSSQGVTSSESVNVSAFNKQAVVLKVYGYLGATGPYGLGIGCS